MKNFLNVPLGRASYLVWGLVLCLLKVAIDWGTARAYGRAYSVLFYVSPVDAPLFRRSDDTAYWGTLAMVTVPFVVVGVFLTARRLRDAGLSSWMVLLFFVPFANLLFFVACASLPSRSPMLVTPEQPIYRGGPLGSPVIPLPRPVATSTWIAATFGAVIGVGTLGISVGLLKEYGAALMIGAPAITGFATGAFYARLEPTSNHRRAAAATAIASVLILAVTIVFAFEGAICLLMAFPLFLIPVFLCSFIGFEVAKTAPKRAVGTMIAGSMLLFPALLGVEGFNPLPPLMPPQVVTSIDIDAPPETVWPLVTEVSEMSTPDELLFRVGISYPMHATLDAPRVGAVRRCEFNTGTALETVQVWAPPRELSFRIDTQPDPMREATLWSGPRQPHLDGYVRNQTGQFTLEPLGEGRTRLTGRSSYTVRITPESYWRVWSDAVIHAIHERVLRHVKTRAEAAVRAPIAAAPREAN